MSTRQHGTHAVGAVNDACLHITHEEVVREVLGLWAKRATVTHGPGTAQLLLRLHTIESEMLK